MLTEDKINQTRHRMKKNAKFRARIKWFQLGQRRCHCCSSQLHWDAGSAFDHSATAEHMVPKSMGGTLHTTNIIIVCRKCNETRGNKDWVEWVEENQFPKKEWLLQKYFDAISHYKTNKGKTKLSININIKMG